MDEYNFNDYKKALESGVSLSRYPSAQNNKELVLVAVNKKGTELFHASDELKGDKEVVMAAVSNDGDALASARGGLNDDKEIVLAAVNQSGTALRAASERLKIDEDVVRAAVNQNGFALYDIYWLSDEIPFYKEIALAAIQKNKKVCDAVSPKFVNDEDIIAACKSGGTRKRRRKSKKTRRMLKRSW